MNKQPRKGGRPPGKKKTAKIEVVLEPKLKEDFMSFMHEDGKCASVEVGNWIKDYVREKSASYSVSEDLITEEVKS